MIFFLKVSMYIKYIIGILHFLYFIPIMYINIYRSINKYRIMKNYTVKARQRYGSNSIDLTLPASIRKKYSINHGDIFRIKASKKNEKLTLEYKLIYQNIDEDDEEQEE